MAARKRGSDDFEPPEKLGGKTGKASRGAVDESDCPKASLSKDERVQYAEEASKMAALLRSSARRRHGCAGGAGAAAGSAVSGLAGLFKEDYSVRCNRFKQYFKVLTEVAGTMSDVHACCDLTKTVVVDDLVVDQAAEMVLMREHPAVNIIFQYKTDKGDIATRFLQPLKADTEGWKVGYYESAFREKFSTINLVGKTLSFESAIYGIEDFCGVPNQIPGAKASLPSDIKTRYSHIDIIGLPTIKELNHLDKYPYKLPSYDHRGAYDRGW